MISIRQVSNKDIKQRQKFSSSEITRRNYKYFKLISRNMGYMPLYTFSKIRYKNACLVSGSSHSVYSKGLKLSRHQIKYYFKHLTGLRSSSW